MRGPHPTLTDKALLKVQGLNKTYRRRKSAPRSENQIKAVDSVSFELHAGSSIAFVGESGSGKSTLAMCISRLEEADSGRVILEGTDLLALSGDSLRRVRPKVQMVFQDAATSFNPRFTATEVVREPMIIQRAGDSRQQTELAMELMQRVGLSADSFDRTPMQFSGGQKQRLAIARALAADARVIILDESLSALDMSIQTEIADLLRGAQVERGLALIHVSHDMELAGALADIIAVMNTGRIVEMGPSSEILQRPQHPQTRALVDAMLSFESPA